MNSFLGSKRLDLLIIAITATLTLYGLLAIYASSALKSVEIYHQAHFFFRKQALAALLGFFIVFLLHNIPIDWLSRFTLPLLLTSLLSLSLIIFPNFYSKVGGASRWLSLGGVRFQPAELAKIALIFFLAKNISRNGFNINSFFKGVLPNFAVLAIFCFLLLLQPDFGTAVLLTSLTILMLYIGGLHRKHLFIACTGVVLSSAVGVLVAPYRLKRVLSFLDPWNNFQGNGFQIIQSFLSFQNGGLLGVGLGSSKQKLFFLPEAHTDFILSVIAEEGGLVGTIFVCFSLFLIVLCGIFITSSLKDRFQKFLAFGLTSLVAMQSIFNIGVVMGLLPTKGIPLPFLSSGISSLLVFIFIVGVLARLARETLKESTV